MFQCLQKLKNLWKFYKFKCMKHCQYKYIEFIPFDLKGVPVAILTQGIEITKLNVFYFFRKALCTVLCVLEGWIDP